jgi:CRISPR-associated endonuclease Cas3-HD
MVLNWFAGLSNMMQVIAINQSTKKAKKQASKILNQFLFGVKNNVLQGFLSNESLNIVVEELKKINSKNISVQLIRQYAHESEEIIHIGLKTKTKKPNQFVANLLLTAELAGLWHDYGKIDPDFQKMLRSDERIKASVHHSLVSYYALKAKVSGKNDYSCRDTDCIDGGDLFDTAAKAVLTHHHKPTSSNDRYQFLEADKFGADISASVATLLKPISESWSAKSEALISRLKRKNSELHSPNLAFYATRLALMISDHATSKHEMTKEYDAKHKHDDKEFVPGKLYAKSTKLIPLDRHLSYVANGAKDAIRSIFMHDYPSVKRLPKIHDTTPFGAFIWQQHATDSILTANLKKEDGFFGVVIGETGSGKTQCGYLVMSALRKHNPRFVLGLGFGALAVQSGREYQKEIGLNDNELGVFVGYKHRAKTKSGDTVESMEIEPVFKHKNLDHGLSDIVEKLFTEKDLSLITVPVAVMTIDHIINAITADRGAYVKSALRIASSDLLIDEVDSFSAQDCHAIARLCYLTGLFGKRVVVSSATLPPELSAMLFSAYQAGFNEHSKSFGGQLYVGSFSNKTNPSITEVKDAFDSFSYFNGYTKNISELLQQQKQRNKIESLNLLKCNKNNLIPVFEAILDSAIKKAKIHHSNIPQIFSSCFIRFNFTKDAQAFFLYLINNADRIKNETGWTIKTNFYSGQMDESARKELESNLSLIMNRKNDDWITEEIKRTENKTLFILVTTPVIEVGRDFDFDFCVLEPSSYMSIIQSAGRVLRHRRDYFPDDPNVILMSDSIRGLTGNLSDINKCRFGDRGPGFQQQKPGKTAINISNKILSNFSINEIFGINRFNDGIHAGYRLHTDNACVADSEEKRLIDLFFKGEGFNESILNFINSSASLVSKYFDHILFRDNEPRDEVVFKKDGNSFIKMDDENIRIIFDKLDIEESNCFIKLNIFFTKIIISETATDVVYSPYIGVLKNNSLANLV